MLRRNRSYHTEDEEHLSVTRGYRIRLRTLYGVLLLCLLLFVGVLYDAQIVQGEAFYLQSSSKIAQEEPVESSRGNLTDRNGKVLITNRQVFTVNFDVSLLEEGQDINQAIYNILLLLEGYDLTWTDNLPVTREAPFSYTLADGSNQQRSRFQSYLADLGWSEKELTAESPLPVLTAETMADLGRSSSSLGAGLLLELLREHYQIDQNLSDAEARKIIGVRYELDLRPIINATSYIEPYVLTEDVPVEVISILTDGHYAGVVVNTRAVRQYNTDSASHILGRIGAISANDVDMYLAQGYQMDDLVGLSGAEKAFESYLRGEDGTQVITTNEEGKITGELYTKEPKPGSTVALTIDIDFQAQVEEILAQAVAAMNQEDQDETRGAAAAVVQVGTGEVLALASYPTYSLSPYDSAANAANPASPEFNRAIMGAYAPGSTFKMLTAVAALETGVITPSTKIQDKGVYTYYAPSYQPKCWIYRQGGGTHGNINISQALYHSCNYFFYEIGRLTGIETIDRYAAAFGLGQATGIELPGERTGVLAGPDYSKSQGQVWYDGNTLQAAIGQSDNLFTPLQMANYIATLAGGGDRYEAHLLKNVKSYDSTVLEYLYDKGPVDRVEMSDSTLQAVKKGMGDLVSSGSVSRYFQDCIVSAGAKTGSVQTGEKVANGVFVCFAPFEEPEIAVAIVIEKGGSGSALASSAVSILNAWFGSGETTATILPEDVLLP